MAAVMMMGIGSVSAQAEGVDILSNIKAKGEIRTRYEMIDEGGKDNANAFTNRLLIGVGADLLGTDWLSAYAEITDVHALNENYNSTANGQTNHAVVVDPEQTRLTQAYVDAKFGGTKVRIGRQVISLDNQRFISAINWRQMFQTFDAVSVTNNSIKNLDLFVAYVTQINRLFDQETTSGPTDGLRDTRTLLLNASYKVMPELKVTAYGYLIGEGTEGGGSDTYGISLTGGIAVSNGVKLDYRAEYATQTDPSMENSGNPTTENLDANYYNLELGANISGVLAGVKYESFSGRNASGTETAFQTPLALVHAYNGWTDKFVITPAGGLEDMNVMVGYKSKDLGVFKIIYHDFSSEVGSVDYGTEIDAVYTRAVPGINGLVGTLKVADYDADAFSVDTTKFWAMLDYKFSTK